MTSSSNDEQKDRELSELFGSLELPSHRSAQIEERVVAAVRQREERISLTAEWIELLRVRPLFTTGVALAGGAALLLLSPTSGLLAALWG